MTEKLKRLNCMNYIVENSETHYYLQCGLRSLFNLSKREGVNFKELCNALSTKGYIVLADNDTQVSMI